ncbi:MAG TPA: hypothetical protein VHH33_03535 [Nitrososphaeraceae archaeon]|jgi:hypothetical protein|nr:hypothetical protein [Nitrososphaeraceae archaeon]
MILRSKTLLLLSIVLLIGTILGASATNVFADDPFKNIREIDDVPLPVGFVDRIKVISIPIE